MSFERPYNTYIPCSRTCTGITTCIIVQLVYNTYIILYMELAHFPFQSIFIKVNYGNFNVFSQDSLFLFRETIYTYIPKGILITTMFSSVIILRSLLYTSRVFRSCLINNYRINHVSNLFFARRRRRRKRIFPLFPAFSVG